MSWKPGGEEARKGDHLAAVRKEKGGRADKARRRAVHWVRRAAQLCFLALFVALAWAASYPPSGAVDENLFLRVDPLAAFAAAHASSLWLYLVPAWILLGLTLVSGRFFCGWICPLGTVLEAIPSPRGRRRGKLSQLRPRDILGRAIEEGHLRLRLKYIFLAVLVLLFLLGANLLWVFDPLVIGNRAVVFILAGSVPPVFLALVVLAAVAGPRFWCQEMCPLGACLSLAGMAGSRLPASASPMALVKEESSCIHCGKCALACPFGIVEVADSRRTGRLALADCALCGECVAACPREGALSLRAMGVPVMVSRGKGKVDETGDGAEEAACAT
ncbi:MAG: 4Fe-4S binding protein [Actinobacteria bacterium]|nr:4Fe-4S binding protein [Actinomycetota bacterium]